MCPFTASRAFQPATLAVAPQFFQTGSSELALMAGKLQAHISICQPDEPQFTRDLPSLAVTEGQPEREEGSLLQPNTTNTF